MKSGWDVECWEPGRRQPWRMMGRQGGAGGAWSPVRVRQGRWFAHGGRAHPLGCFVDVQQGVKKQQKPPCATSQWCSRTPLPALPSLRFSLDKSSQTIRSGSALPRPAPSGALSLGRITDPPTKPSDAKEGSAGWQSGGLVLQGRRKQAGF